MASTKNGQEMMHERLKFTLSCVEKIISRLPATTLMKRDYA